MAHSTHCRRQQGFTIIELMIAVAIVGALAGLAIPNYLGYLDKARLTRCIAEIRYIERAIDSYEAANESLPNTLVEVGAGDMVDPWGNPYEYLNIAALTLPGGGGGNGGLQFAVEKAVSNVPEVEFVFSKTGTAEMASDPMPPNVSDTFIILKDKDQWPDSGATKDEVLSKINKAVSDVPGNNYEFTQPIQMRFNELISGVRSDVAVKIYGDDFSAMEKTASQLVQTLKTIDGSADVKMEQTSGLPML